FRIAIFWPLPQYESVWMCKPCMFSHRVGVLQTAAVKRAENRSNGEAAPSSGERSFDQRNEYFALDSGANILHSGITSQTISVAGAAKLLFACQPCRGIAIHLTLLFSTSI
ncbi:MAG: hypothetical protein WAU76_06775, partial [Candidatus Sulfotelmatobacter sp.]